MCEQVTKPKVDTDHPIYFRRFRMNEFLAANEPEPIATADFMPTHVTPGTPEKVSVLADRFQQGLPLWHRDDFRWDRGETDE